MTTGHVVLVEEHDVALLERITVLAVHRLQILEILRCRDEGVVNLLRVNEAELRTTCARLGGETDIDFFLLEQSECLCGRLCDDRHTDVRILLHEGLEIWQQDVAAECRRYTDLQVADIEILHTLQLGLRVIDIIKRILNIAVEHRALLCQRNTARIPVKELRIESVLELHDGLGDRRL